MNFLSPRRQAWFLLLLALSPASGWAKSKKAAKSDSFRSAIQAREEEFRGCFEKEAIKDGGDTSGESKKDSNGTKTVETHFVIDPTGKAVLVRVTRSIPPQPRAEACIMSLLRQIHFPRPANGKPQEVSFPFYYGR